MGIKEQSIEKAKMVANWYTPSAWRAHGWLWRVALVGGTLFVLNVFLMLWWSREPDGFSVRDAAVAYLPEGREPVVGSHLVGSSIKILDVLLHKSGGFIKNDVAPPGVFLDNISAWEYGVVTLMRETTLALNNDFSRAQSQSARVSFLSNADNNIRIDSASWWFPRPEAAYEKARQDLMTYALELSDENEQNAQFYARADNLSNYFALVSKSLGDITQTLSASVGDVVVADDGEALGEAQAKSEPKVRAERTPWHLVDDNFYFARGYAWALLHQLRAIRIDFEGILQKKGALATLDQIIMELEKTQRAVWSPVILNGSGFGFVSNHSLVMAAYISRANAALIDLQNLLKNG